MSASRLRTLAGAAFTSVAIALSAPAAAAQRASAAPLDSASAVCMDVSWLDSTARCEGRASNAFVLGVLGATAGAIPGYVGQSLAPMACTGDRDHAAIRGAIAGATLGAAAALVTRYVSRRVVAEQDARAREEARHKPVEPWTWKDWQPVITVLGVATTAGSAIGAVQGTRRPAACDGVPGGAARGALVYGGGTAASIGAAVVVVRWMF